MFCLARVISLSGYLTGSIFIREGDIASTQNLLISFTSIICKLNYSHVIINYVACFFFRLCTNLTFCINVDSHLYRIYISKLCIPITRYSGLLYAPGNSRLRFSYEFFFLWHIECRWFSLFIKVHVGDQFCDNFCGMSMSLSGLNVIDKSQWLSVTAEILHCISG